MKFSLHEDFSALQMIWKRDMIRLSRDRAQISGSIARPVLWLLILGFGMGPAFVTAGKVAYVAYLFPGIIALNLLYAGFLSAISIIWDREFGFLKEMLVAPISRTSIVIGKTLSGATVATLQGVLVLLFLPLIHVHVSIGRILMALPFIFLIAFAITALGLVVASRMTSFEGFGTIANFVIMPMFLLSGTVFPMDSAPPALKVLGALNPLTYGVDGLRGIFLGISHMPLAVDIGVQVGFAFLMMLGAGLAFCRRM